jgi:hypothetical protein
MARFTDVTMREKFNASSVNRASKASLVPLFLMRTGNKEGVLTIQ